MDDTAVDEIPEGDFVPDILANQDSFTEYPSDMVPIDSTAARGILYSVIKLGRLGVGKMVDDEIINIYLKHILIPNSHVQDICCVSTFFFQELYFGNKSASSTTSDHYYDYNSAEPFWDCAALANIVLIPIGHSSHWTLMVFKQNENEIHYHDSLGLPNGREGLEYMEILRRFVESYNQKHSKPRMSKDWNMRGCRHHHVYQKKRKAFNPPFPQRNDYDCGIFLIRYAMCYTSGHKIKSITEDCSLTRMQMKKDLLGLYVHYYKSCVSATVLTLTDGEGSMDSNEHISDRAMGSIVEVNKISDDNRRGEVAGVLTEIVGIVEKRARVVEDLEKTPTKKRRFGDYDLPECGSSKYARATKEFPRVLRNRELTIDDLDDDEVDDMPLYRLARIIRSSMPRSGI